MKRLVVDVFLSLAFLFAFGAGGVELAVSLETPEHVLLADEIYPVKVALENRGAGAVPVIAAPPTALNRQVFFVAGCGAGDDVRDVFDPPAARKWPHIAQRRYMAMGEAAAGGRWEWDYTDFMPERLVRYGVTNIAVSVLVGADRWCHSQTNTIRFLWKEVKDGRMLFEGAYLRLSESEAFKVYEVELDQERFLFMDAGSRICRIPAGVTPSFSVDGVTAVLTVSFGAGHEPVRYHVPSLGALRPWEDE